MDSSEIDSGLAVYLLILVTLLQIGLVVLVIIIIRWVLMIPKRVNLLTDILFELRAINSKMRIEIKEKPNQSRPVLKKSEIIAECPVCKEKQSVPLEYDGRKIKCQICRSEYIVKQKT
jgi:hypothetical protein